MRDLIELFAIIDNITLSDILKILFGALLVYTYAYVGFTPIDIGA